MEDRGIIAAKIRRDLTAAGFAVAGAVATVKAAAEMVEQLAPSAAVLDVDLRGEPVFPVAALLQARATPFLFLTGYSRQALPPEWQEVPLLEKPFDGVALARALRDVMDGGRAVPVDPRRATGAIRRAWDQLRHTRDLVTEQRAWTEQAGFAP